ncbi:MAG TPA: ornithine carbamoyltransferase [Bacillales bacterium]|nr:ornithine carbamoyltransferase [Bacillales bacterium]
MITTVVKETEKLKGKDCLTLADFSSGEIMALLDLAQQLKVEKFSPLLMGKSLGMIFEKPSTRTRVSFEVGMTQLGGHALYLNGHDLQLGRGETISDTAKVLSRYVDAIMIRTFEQEKVESLAEAADVPVINGLTNEFHPCQVLADLLTIREKLGGLVGKTLVYVGDGNNMAHSLMIGAAKVGMNCIIAVPPGYEPDPRITEKAHIIGAASGAVIKVQNDPSVAVQTADVVYTDVWSSMGDEKQGEGLNGFAPYQVNSRLLSYAEKPVLFMHCLPAHRGEEVEAEVIDGSNSIVFDQAENRLHAQKALLAALLG